MLTNLFRQTHFYFQQDGIAVQICHKFEQKNQPTTVPRIRGILLPFPKPTKTSTMLTNLYKQTHFHFQRDAIAVQICHKFQHKKTTKKCPSDPRHTFALLKNDRNFNNAYKFVQTNALQFSTRYTCSADKSEI